MAIVHVKDTAGPEEIGSEVAEFDLVQDHARAEPRDETEHLEGNAGMDEQQDERQSVDAGQLGGGAGNPLRSFGKDERKMEEQRRRQQARHDIGPVHFPVECVELAAEVEGKQNERDQAKDVEMNRAGRVPAPHKDEQPDEQIEESDEPEIVFNGGGSLARGRNDRRFKLHVVPRHAIAQFRPQPGVPQTLGDLHG